MRKLHLPKRFSAHEFDGKTNINTIAVLDVTAYCLNGYEVYCLVRVRYIMIRQISTMQ
jgi:hypothetical protein